MAMNLLQKAFSGFSREALHEPAHLTTGLLSYIDQERFQELLESAPDAMVIVNEQGRIIFVTAQAEQVFGYQPTELLQRDIAMLMPERFRAKLGKFRHEYFEDPQTQRIGEEMNLYGIRKDGSEFAVEISLSPFKTQKGTIVSGSIRDVTDRKAIEQLYKREHHIAITYQEASLPKKLPDVLGIVFHSFYAPGKSEALLGGDWYDAVRLLDGRIIISIGDVAGSGLKAAVIMANMRQVIRGSGYVNPNPVLMLNAADKMLRGEYPDTTVTAFVGILDPIERTLIFASAGHPSPYLHVPGKVLTTLPTHGLILGLRGRDEPLSQTVAVEDETTLILYTDGLTEFTRDHKEGEKRLRTALESTDLYRSSNVAKALYDVVLPDGAQDDVAILAVHWRSLPIETGWPLSRWVFDVHDAEAAKNARTAFTLQLQADNVSANDIAKAELVFMELIGNIVRYAPGQVEIAVDWSGVTPVLHAIDHGPGFSRNPKLPDLFAESGRGIYLISMLTEEFQVLQVPGGGSHACAVLLLGTPTEIGA
jgi:PAS domain S-box-containing protein